MSDIAQRKRVSESRNRAADCLRELPISYGVMSERCRANVMTTIDDLNWALDELIEEDRVQNKARREAEADAEIS